MNRIIGVDESGKGDFFGPLVVGGILIPDSAVTELRAIGVRDSKTLSDSRALELDENLRNRFPHVVAVLLPSEYNRIYKTIRNLNILLARQHALVISELASAHAADLAISDKFGKPELIERELGKTASTIELRQIVRGETIAQVAAASIIARAGFLRAMDTLSEQVGVTLPKGAGEIVDRIGRQLVAKNGAAVLDGVAKIHFKNYGRSVKPALI